jgi:hypothetical protein
MNHTAGHSLEQFWSLLLEGEGGGAAALIEEGGKWDDPLFDAAAGDAVRAVAIPRLAAWARGKAQRGAESVQHLRTTADEKRVVVEGVLGLRDGVVWNQAEQRSEQAERFELATALVGDRSTTDPGRYRSIRIYFSTWAALNVDFGSWACLSAEVASFG